MKLIRSLRHWLRVLTWSGLAALALSLFVIGATKVLVADPLIGWPVLVGLAFATAVAVCSAAMLGRAIFQQPDSWK